MHGGTGVPAMLGGLSTLSPSELQNCGPLGHPYRPSLSCNLLEILYIVSIKLTYCRCDQ